MSSKSLPLVRTSWAKWPCADAAATRAAALAGMALAIAALVSAASYGAVLRVPSQYATVQGAIDAAAWYDTVLVAPGHYQENLYVQRALTLLSEDGAAVTTIEGRGGFSGAVIRVAMVAVWVQIEGFRLTGGTYSGSYWGGGIWVDSDPDYCPESIIRGNILEYNDHVAGPGGLYGCRTTAEDNVFQFNNLPTADADASVVFAWGFDSFQRNIVRNNGSSDHGWTVWLPSSNDSEIAENVIVDNDAAMQWGTVFFEGGGLIRNNTIANNNTWGHYFAEVTIGTRFPYEVVTFTHNLIAHHERAPEGLHCSLEPQGGFHVITCNDVWGVGPSYGGHCTYALGVDGNISEDPLFCDPAAGDYRLSPDSPCAPENSPASCGLIGALPVCGVTSVVGEWTGAPRVHLTVVPNPVRSGATFTFDEGIESSALEIYDPNGRLIDLLRPSGQSATWLPGTEVQSGVYFARLRGADGARVVRFLVLR